MTNPTVPNPSERPTLTVEEAAEYLGISRGTAYKAARSGAIPALQIGPRRMVIPTAQLRRFLGMDPEGAS